MAKLLLLLECLLCQDKFSEDAVPKKEFYLETLICKKCYKRAQELPAKVWCFGKLHRRGSPGFSEGNVACQTLCPDRVICRRFINVKEHKAHGYKKGKKGKRQGQG